MSKPQSLIDMEENFNQAMADEGITSEADIYKKGSEELQMLYEQLEIKRADFKRGWVIRGGRRMRRRTMRRKSIHRKTRNMRSRK